MTSQPPLLALRDACIDYRSGAGRYRAVSDLSLELNPGEILGLVGESGCGKSSTARALMGLHPLASGELLVDGIAVRMRSRALRDKVQAIFQNPAGSFNPKRSIVDSVAEPLRVNGRGDRRERRRAALAELERVGISESVALRRPSEISGGQCQRAAIARATILRPEVLICDEPVSALDVSIQAQILALLAELRDELGLAMLFISHDLSVVATLCDRTAVMYAGKIVEQGLTLDVALTPRHPYTSILHAAVPQLGPSSLEHQPTLVTRAESSGDPRELKGCRFARSCPSFTDECDVESPQLVQSGEGRVACYHPIGVEHGATTTASR